MKAPLEVDVALAQVLAHCRSLGCESVSLSQARGRVLATDVVAGDDLPAFDNSAVDGYAVRSADLRSAADAPVTLPLAARIAAGDRTVPLPEGHTAAIMTGAPVPLGADAVVMLEAAEADGGSVTFRHSVVPGANIRSRGYDLRRGETVLGAGTTLGHTALAVLAALGVTPVTVTRRPRAAFISTGDELVDVADSPGPGQLRDSSMVALPAQLAVAGAEVVAVRHAVDSPTELEAALRGLPEVDLVVTTGGVSMGERDFVRPVFERLGEVVFWRVAMKPGKPLLFGRLGEALFFGLPGNPVSSMVSCDVFVRPAIDALSGRRDGGRTSLRAALTADLQSEAGRTEYVRVYAWADGEQWRARPTGDQSSGRLASMLGANAYAVLPRGVSEARAGESVTVELFDPGPGGVA